MLRLTTFGGLALSRDGVALTGAAAQRSRLSLLALLATAGPTGFSRDKLLLYLWPESDEERARHALKQAVYSLRRELGSEEVIVGTASLSLNPVIITSDAREFEAAIAAGDLATAERLLGRRVSLVGTVERARREATELGFSMPVALPAPSSLLVTVRTPAGAVRHREVAVDESGVRLAPGVPSLTGARVVVELLRPARPA